jgi:OOP family OmpA-OmpF porin
MRKGGYVMRKIFSFVAVVFALTSNPVFSAEGEVSKLKFYGGAGIGQSNIDSGISALTGTATLDEKDTAYKVMVGAQLNKFIALEGHYADLGEAVLTGNNGDTLVTDGSTFAFTANNTNVTSTSDSIGAAVIGIVPINKSFSAFAKVGFHRWKTSESTTSNAGNASESENGTDPFIGAGISLNLSDSISIRGEFERFNFDDEDYDLISTSLIFMF